MALLILFESLNFKWNLRKLIRGYMPSTTPCNECHKHEMWEDQSYRNNTIYQNNLWIKYSFLVNDFDISQLFLSVVIFFRWNSAVFCMYFWIVWSFSINWHLVYCNFKAILSSRMNWVFLGWGMDTSCTNHYQLW